MSRMDGFQGVLGAYFSISVEACVKLRNSSGNNYVVSGSLKT